MERSEEHTQSSKESIKEERKKREKLWGGQGQWPKAGAPGAFPAINDCPANPVSPGFGRVMYVHTYSKSRDQAGKAANPARGQLNREIGYFRVRIRA